ncbi:hypothetical protein K8I61_01745 [bacterium]|nr:hypothetical protein [bacterium]
MVIVQALFVAGLVYFGVTLMLVAMRVFSRRGIDALAVDPSRRDDDRDIDVSLETRYRELIELGMIQLEPDERVVTGCGHKGDNEEVMLVTNRRVFVMSRPADGMFYRKQVMKLQQMRPLPSSAGVKGNKIVLSDGTTTAVMDSPGDEGTLDDTRAVVRELNNLIRYTQSMLDA